MHKRILVKVVILALAALAVLWFSRSWVTEESARRQALAAFTGRNGERGAGEFVVTQTKQPDGTIVRTGQFVRTAPAPAAVPAAAPAGKAAAPAAAVCDRVIVRVSDGDTVILDGKEKIRLLGVDTPEKFASDKLDKQAAKLQVASEDIINLGLRASEFTKKLCAGKRCRLVLDERPKDDYGRTLGYLFLEDGTCVNRELIEKGYASVYKWFPYSRRDEFLRLEKQARRENRGLWGEPLFRRLAGE